MAYIKKYLGWAISISLIVWLCVSVDAGTLKNLLVEANYWYLIPLTVVLLLHYLARAIRWRYLVVGGEEMPLASLFDGITIGNLATGILPLRAGEFIRPMVLVYDGLTSYAIAFSSVVVERFFDLLAVLISLLWIIGRVDSLPSWAVLGGEMLAGIGGLILLGLLACTYADRALCRLMNTIPLIKNTKASGVISDLIKGCSPLKSGKNMLFIVLTTVVVWFLTYLNFTVGFWMFDLKLPIEAGLVVTVVLALAVAAPSAPGFVGIFQTACIAALAIYGVDKERALAYSVVLHAHNLAFLAVCGSLGLIRRGTTLKKIRA